MSFADTYLQKHALRGPLISTPPQDDLQCVVAIPSFNESGLLRCLDSLFLCDPPGVQCEVIVLINAAEDSPEEVLEVNRASYEAMLEWSRSHTREDIVFHAIYIDGLPAKHAGAGLARKLVMDEAVRRLGEAESGRAGEWEKGRAGDWESGRAGEWEKGRAGDWESGRKGVVLSLDADATVSENYLSELVRHFEDKNISGCSIYFEHPLDSSSVRQFDSSSNSSSVRQFVCSSVDFPNEVYKAITNYELHLRYYLQAVRYTGFPWAFHTVGSCFAVRAKTYCSQGGMNKRQAGEDFYFIQKVARLGTFTDLSSTTVYPSPRPSNRVVFGTGPDIQRQLDNPGAPYLSYDFRLFEMLREFFACAGSFFEGDVATLISPLPNLLKEYLELSKYSEALEEIRSNAASGATFRDRFFRHFNMLWILKFLHWAETKGYGKVELGPSSIELLHRLQIKPEGKGNRTLLKAYRVLDRK